MKTIQTKIINAVQYMLLTVMFSVLMQTHKAEAQTVTFTINQQPCNSNGIITASIPSNLTLPITVMYYFSSGTPSVTHTITAGYTDVLTNYSGEQMNVYASDAAQNYAYGSFSALPFTVTHSEVYNTCPTPSTSTLTITGGASPYAYQWTYTQTGAVIGTSNPLSTNLSGVQIGYLVTDGNGCTVKSDSSIYMYSQPPFSFNLNTTNASCTNGTVSVGTISGTSTPPFSYLWNNGASTASIANLTAGYYNVTITDANGCTSTGATNVSQTPLINVNATITAATCLQTNGSAIAFGSGGTPPYTYQWSNGVNNNTITNVQSGSYNVNVTDANGCISGIASVYINSSTPISATYSNTTSSCTNPTGSATVTISGGTSPYTTTWNTSPMVTGNSISGYASGYYSFNIVDNVGCRQSGTAYIPPVNSVYGYFNSTQPVCTQNNGSLIVSPSGGTSPYAYVWNNSATSQSINNLSAGYYSVIITDAVGCTKNVSTSLQAYSPVSVGLSTTPTTCVYANNGAIVGSAFGGSTPYTYSWSNGGNTSAINNLAIGGYSLYVADANGCTASAYSYVSSNNTSNACYCTVTGTVYYDANGNCTKDAGEVGIPNIQMYLSGFGYCYTDANGVYSFQVPSGTYNLYENINTYYPLSACQTNGIVVNATASSGCVISNDFANSMLTIHDMKVSLWSGWSRPVPGNNYNQILIVENNGTVTESASIAGYKSDGQLNTATFSPGSFSNPTSNLNWFENNSMPVLLPGSSATFNVNYLTPTNTPINTLIQFNDSCTDSSPMSNWLLDYSPWDNVNAYSDNVVSSFDPNNKEVYPRGSGPLGIIGRSDSILEYKVHFQNTGTYYAQNILVLDTLDANLNWTTLKPGYKSHNCEVTISDNGVAKFNFKNIQLPYKNQDAVLSNGTFTYSIHTKSGLPIGSTFKNSASIYFDYNEPIRTNKTINTLDTTSASGITSIQTKENYQISVAPNPMKEFATIRIDGLKGATDIDLTITNVLGEKVKMLTHQTNIITLSRNDLSSGIYFYELKNNGKKIGNGKIVIE